MSWKSRIATTFLVVAVFLVGYFINVNAQTPEGFTFSKILYDLSGNRGDQLSNTVRITNNDPQIAYDVTVTPKNSVVVGEDGNAGLTEEDTNYSLSDWVTTTHEKFSIGPKETVDVGFNVDIPDKAEPGSHFGLIAFFAVPSNQEDLQGTGARVAQEFGPHVLVKVAGDIRESGELVEFTSEKSFYEKGPVNLNARLRNTGNVHFQPSGTVTIKNMFGRTVETIQVPRLNVLPESIRRIPVEWAPDFAMGRYTADLAIIAGSSGDPITASTSFTVIPYKIVVPALLAFIALIFIAVRYRDRFAKAGRILSGKD